MHATAEQEASDWISSIHEAMNHHRNAVNTQSHNLDTKVSGAAQLDAFRPDMIVKVRQSCCMFSGVIRAIGGFLTQTSWEIDQHEGCNDARWDEENYL